ncbi:MAG: porin, partial [Holosporales bacterium]|nr:porin [Holosporales bacterium]
MMRMVVYALLGVLLTSVKCFASNSAGNQDLNDPVPVVEKKEKEKGRTVLKPAEDGNPEFDISGSAAFHFGMASPNITYYDGNNAPGQIKTNQKSSEETSKDTSCARMCAGEAEVNFSAKGSLTNGWFYGAFLSMDAMKGDTGIDKAYISFERDNFGTIHAGNVRGPESNFMCGGQQLIGGIYGADGAYPFDLDYATGVINPVYILGFSNKATKMVYYTPTISGFQAGFSVTPDTKHVGHEAKNKGTGDSSLGNDSGLFVKGDKDSE